MYQSSKLQEACTLRIRPTRLKIDPNVFAKVEWNDWVIKGPGMSSRVCVTG